MSSMHIIHQGEDSYKRTNDFLKKEKEIRQQINLKYKVLIGTEKQFLDVKKFGYATKHCCIRHCQN